MTDPDRQPQCPTCKRRLCVVTIEAGKMRCTNCRKDFPDPRSK